MQLAQASAGDGDADDIDALAADLDDPELVPERGADRGEQPVPEQQQPDGDIQRGPEPPRLGVVDEVGAGGELMAERQAMAR